MRDEVGIGKLLPLMNGAYLLGIPRPAFVLVLLVPTAQECPYQVLGHRHIMAATRLHACVFATIYP